MVINRAISQLLLAHFGENRQMAFVSGPRQVGKTTVARSLVAAYPDSVYLNWDNQDHRQLLVQGPNAVARELGVPALREELPLCAFDELHKYRQWRDLLKGLFDEYAEQLHMLVTGSASLETFRRGGDSLMGRYFPYTLHPMSVAEWCGVPAPGQLIRAPSRIDDEAWASLLKFGGFPEPFLRGDQRFYNRWRSLRTEQLIRDDLRDLTRIQEVDQVELLVNLLREQVGQLTSYTSLARAVRVSVDTIRRWLATLESLYFCFSVRPWYHNVKRALRKEPKYYLWDWSQVEDPGARAENLVASALLKAVDWWTQTGDGEFGLYFLRDKQQREVDFLVVRDSRPWFLVEVKRSGKQPLSPSLDYFQRQTGAAHAFQVVLDLDYVERDCFAHRESIRVPAKTFLAQLV